MNRKKVLKATAEAFRELILEHPAVIDIYLDERHQMDLEANIGCIRRAYPFVADWYVRCNYAVMNTVLPGVRLLVYRRYIEENGYHFIIKIK